MKNDPCYYSDPRSSHARNRQKQRATSDEAVDAALRWGRIIRQVHHRTAYFLDDRSVEAAVRAGETLTPYVGTAVVVAADGTLVTVIRCRDSRKLKRLAQGARAHVRSPSASRMFGELDPTASYFLLPSRS